MNVGGLFINITSENPLALLAFYRDVIGLEPNPNMGEAALNVAGATIAFDGHSEVHGKAKEPHRVLIDLFVDDIKAEQARLEAAGVKFIRTQGKEPWGGIISTFPDPDGNYVQLIEYKPS